MRCLGAVFLCNIYETLRLIMVGTTKTSGPPSWLSLLADATRPFLCTVLMFTAAQPSLPNPSTCRGCASLAGGVGVGKGVSLVTHHRICGFDSMCRMHPDCIYWLSSSLYTDSGHPNVALQSASPGLPHLRAGEQHLAVSRSITTSTSHPPRPAPLVHRQSKTSEY